MTIVLLMEGKTEKALAKQKLEPFLHERAQNESRPKVNTFQISPPSPPVGGIRSLSPPFGLTFTCK